ncbi:Hg(II)-responsive transcriptional regulator [Thermomonas fusca]|jgi:MerR family mercuric resistance operon transcriptional regulator|uniref:Hg(II)-responsive transcriptional regulator n=1 Tax=Thermomonas fusca TaxID=215690 RepID=UPI0004142A76|nr:Hg(II)-responsive transcriptional regulator [Thermomonas fusca]
MMNIPETLTIGAFAKAAGVNVETIRFYQRKGLLPEPDRPIGGIRRYGPTDVDRVKFVKSAQRLGFNLDEVAQLLKLEDGTHCHEAADLAAARLADVRLRLTDLQRMESTLSHLVKACGSRRGKVSCPLIASLHRPAPAGTTHIKG